MSLGRKLNCITEKGAYIYLNVMGVLYIYFFFESD